MVQFRDGEHTVGPMVFQGARELHVEECCSDFVLQGLSRWRQRTDPTKPEGHQFRADGILMFTISYDGESFEHYPDEASNLLGESLVRDFLFENGICVLDDLRVRLYETRFHVLSLEDKEHLLVCPYPTRANNIGGMLVLCVNRFLRDRQHRS